MHREKEVTKKVYHNIINSIELYNRRETIFMNSENGGTSDPCRLLLNLTNKLNLKRGDKYFALSSLLYVEKIKKSYKNNKFKISAPTWN